MGLTSNEYLKVYSYIYQKSYYICRLDLESSLDTGIPANRGKSRKFRLKDGKRKGKTKSALYCQYLYTLAKCKNRIGKLLKQNQKAIDKDILNLPIDFDTF